jgi:hypothetical protein
MAPEMEMRSPFRRALPGSRMWTHPAQEVVMLLRTRLLLGSSLIAAAFAAPAGTVEVLFVNADHYWDAGNTTWDEPANLKEIAIHLRMLSERQLPADQTLKVEVLQVDLAGTVNPFHRAVPVRVISGGADFPKLQLRYSLESGGKLITSGEDWVVDMDYTHGLANRGDSSSLFYEKRMLNVWFKKRFIDALTSPG